MITISENAQKHFFSLLSKEPFGTQIRVFIVNPGTTFAECGVAFCPKDEVEESDIELQYNRFLIYVNKNLLAYLKNAEIDLVFDKLGSQLTLKAPYAKVNISEKQSSLEKRIQYFLDMEVNPQLLMHGGKVHLSKFDKQNSVLKIRFSGGCNGCSMINSTLKDTVEKKLCSAFPEITCVEDETEHLRGQHSFY